jgi:MATE family multidrug resistance protein
LNIAPIFLIFGQSPTIVSLATSYLHALSFGILPNFIMIVLLQFIIGLGHVRIIMIFTLLSVAFNIFFSFALIFGKLGMPALGIAGAGWGTTISYWISLVIVAAYVLLHKSYKDYLRHIFNWHKPCFLLKLMQVGLPMGVMYCFEVGFFFAVTLLMGSISSQMLAANQIAMQYMGTLMAVIFSVAQAITVRMGHLLGAKEIHSAERACYAGLWISGVFMGIAAVFYWCFPAILIAVDLDSHSAKNLAIIHYAEQLFAVSAVFQIFESLRISLFGALRSLMDTRFTLLISIISFWCIALPVGYLLAVHFHFGGAGFWWGMVIGACCSMFLLFRRFRIKIKHYV